MAMAGEFNQLTLWDSQLPGMNGPCQVEPVDFSRNMFINRRKAGSDVFLLCQLRMGGKPQFNSSFQWEHDSLIVHGYIILKQAQRF